MPPIALVLKVSASGELRARHEDRMPRAQAEIALTAVAPAVADEPSMVFQHLGGPPGFQAV
jgi:hypothetical protein